MRARDLGIAVGSGTPGPHGAITDVAGVEVGHCTLVEGEAIRTGVTVVVPAGIWERPLFAGAHRLNGNGEMTGLEWVRESGLLTSPVALTNTHSVGVVRDAMVAVEVARRPRRVGTPGGRRDLGRRAQRHQRPPRAPRAPRARRWRTRRGGAGRRGQRRLRHRHDLPRLQGRHRHRLAASRATSRSACSCRPTTACASAWPSTARRSAGRSVPPRSRCPAEGPERRRLDHRASWRPTRRCCPHQCERLAHRASLGVARTGGAGEHSSGDLLLAFSTGNRAAGRRGARRVPAAAAR